MKNFDPIKVPLENSNIVEASAGTGKTFSIGLLVLRLLLEKNISIQKILMVTFTNAAVAELASRIRKFLKISIDYIETREIKEDYESIKSIVDQNDSSNKLHILKAALTELDEASIQTIHSFCQESLISYALESDQSFGLELQVDILEIANDAVKQYWRREITGLPAEFLKENTVLSLKNFQAAVKENLGGKRLALSGEVDQKSLLLKKKEFDNHCHQEKENFIRNIDNVKIAGFGPRYKQKVKDVVENPGTFYEWLIQNTTTQYINNCRDQIFEAERKMALDIEKCEKDMISSYFLRCIREANTVLKKFLFEKNLITYDELINRMHAAIMNKSDFRNSIKDKFDAVFIDEFQDTDKLQYEIYNKLFGKDKTLFYIGDPKQSIYAWRKADLHTYFQAKNAIPAERQYEMNTNYRSTKAYVDEVESFFGIEDPFYTESDNSLNLDFISVNAIDETSHGLNGADHKFEPLQIFDGENKEEIHEKIPVLVSELLNTEKPYTLNGKRIKSSDIGILVRLNKDGKRIKQSLSQAGIHAVTIDDAQIFNDTDEARFLAYILQAVLETSERNINKALINPFTGDSAEKINNLDKENLLDVFRNYMNTWRESGVYPMLKEYMSDFEVYTRLMDSENPNGLRILSNLTQLLELLQEAEYKLELKPFGSYEYLVKQITESSSEDEFQQRLESDEDAVKISTIHKAKGLEYPIVIAPFLDLKAEEGKKSTLAYKEDHENGEYKFYVKDLSSNEQKELALKQIEQENRRLLYVSLTRAKFHCFLFKNKAKKTALYPFVQNLSTRKFEQTEYGIVNSQRTDEKIKYTNFRKPEKFELADKLYGKLSFSALSLHRANAPKENDGSPRDYDEFIFKTIPGGTSLGTMLHYLFENIDFSGDKAHHKEELQKLLERYYPHLKDELTQGFLQMLDHVLDSSIEVQGNKIELRKLKNSRKRNEMEFDLKIDDLKLSNLKKLEPGPGIQVNCNMSIPAKHGLLNGLIDLFFEYEGKYYILDWKSNYLGDDLSFYKGEDNMREAMNEGNYHLQYLIYSMAAKNYLEQRLPNFDYEKDFGGAIYVYLRGARAGQSSGIYINKPDLNTVEKLQEAFSMKEEITL